MVKAKGPQTTTTEATITTGQVASFRLQRHHLLDCPRSDVVAIARDVCGVQSQITPAAFLQLWARNHKITRAEIEEALWEKRTLVKTSLMRQTVHLIPADEYGVYIAALKSSRVAAALRIMHNCGIQDDEASALTELIVEFLGAGPCGQPAIRAAVRPKVSKRVRWWMDRVWSILRIPIAEGLICYGDGEGNEATFVPSDQWLRSKIKTVPEEQARASLFSNYLRAYGPATIKDFAHWSGMTAAELRPLPAMLAHRLEEMKVGKTACLLLREDRALILGQERCENSVRLLPHFDPYLLAHREKDHLVPARHYKRVYRNQGWISPVVLIGGAVAGVWNHERRGKKLVVSVDAFDRITKPLKVGIEQEAESLAGFLGCTLDACRIAKD